MDNYTPPKTNRYWKRPKPRVYECNVRDAERFYQDSYKQYLSDKEDAARRSSRARSIDTKPTTEFYPHLLAGSFKRETRDAVARQIPDLPPVLAEATKKRWESDYKPVEVSFTARQEGLPSFDPREGSTIEERLEHLKKLRENLGLPPETKAAATSSALASLRSESVGRGAGAGGAHGADFESSYRSEQRSRARASMGGEPEESSSYSYRAERTSRMNGNAGPTEDYKFKSEVNSNDYKYRSERGGDQNPSEYTSRFRSERGGGDQNSTEYTSRFRSDRGGDQNSTEYTSRFRSDRGGDQNSTEYTSRFRSDRGGGDQNSIDYKYKSDLKTDDYKLPSRSTMDFDLPKSERKALNQSPKMERKKDDYSFSSASERKTDKYSSISSAGGSSSGAEKSSRLATKKDVEEEVDDSCVVDMMKKLPSSQEILERISKMELDD